MSRLALTLFGSFRVLLDDAPLANFHSARVQALLAYLALEAQRPHTREALATLFWPDEPDATAKQNLRQALYQLRQRLGESAQADTQTVPFLLISRETVQWNAASSHTLDVTAFTTHLAHRQLEAALALYQGELLAECASGSDRFEEWLLLRREQLHLQALDACAQLTQQALANHDYAQAQTYARRQLALEPWREEAHRQLMQALAESGNRGAALAQYETCQRILAEELGVKPDAITQVLAEQIRAGTASKALKPVAAPSPGWMDWGEAPSAAKLHGRAGELQQLQRWLTIDRCRLIALIGMGGIGKTTLAAHAVRALAGQFDNLVWRSLINAPPLSEMLRVWLQGLSDGPHAELPDGLDAQLTALFELLRQRRCLLVLDNCESIMQAGERAGRYLAGYEDYGQLFKRIGEVNHNSCVLLTSRELPHEAARLERETPLVCSLSLSGLSPESGQLILNEQGLPTSLAHSHALVERYSGNPLALMLVGDTIQDLFEGDVAQFLGESSASLIFDDIRDVLDQQFTRLAPLEQDILLWLAIEREACSLQQISDDLARPIPKRELLEAVNSLRRRSLLEKVSDPQDAGGSGFALQNVVTEYLTDYLIQQVCDEVNTVKPILLQRHALLKAQAKEHVRQTQVRLILQPVAERLMAIVGEVGLGKRCRQLLAGLRAEGAPGYAAGNLLNLLLHLAVNVTGYDFSGLSVWQAYLRGADLPSMNFSAADLAGSAFTDYAGSVMCIAFSPDGETLAAGADNGVIYLWHMAALKLIGVCVGHHGQVGAIDFSADGRLLVSGGDDTTVRIWDAAQRQPVHIMRGHTGGVTSVRFHPDGSSVVSGSTDQHICVWQVDTGQLTHTLHEHTAVVSSLAFSADGVTLASSGFDQVVRLWDWSHKRVRLVLHGHTGPVVAIAVSPQWIVWQGMARMLLASGSHDQTLRIWDVVTGELLGNMAGHTAPVTSVAFSAQGTLLISGSDDQLVRVWDMHEPTHIAPKRMLYGHFGVVNALVAQPALPDEQAVLVSGSFDRSVRVWDVQHSQATAILRGHSKWLQVLVFAPDGQLWVGGSDGQTVRVWDGLTGRARHSLRGHTSLTEKITFSADGTYLASSSWDKTARLWDLSNAQTKHVLRGHRAAVIAAAMGTDARGRRLVATGGLDHDVRLWDLETGVGVGVSGGHTDRVVAFAFHPGGDMLASGSWDHTIGLWDLFNMVQPGYHDGMKPTRFLRGHTAPLECLAFHPAGELLASGSWSGNVRVWHVQTGELIHSFNDHTNGLEMVAFSPDGTLLASCACDHLICVWDVQQGKLLYKLRGHTSWVRCIAFSPDSALLASGSDDGTIKIWDLVSLRAGTCVQTTAMQDPYTGMNIRGVTGISAAQKAALRALGAVDA